NSSGTRSAIIRLVENGSFIIGFAVSVSQLWYLYSVIRYPFSVYVAFDPFVEKRHTDFGLCVLVPCKVNFLHIFRTQINADDTDF
ncbi:MAG: hypothetical protein CUN57_03650, partial [Phototrophicales bacterium]